MENVVNEWDWNEQTWNLMDKKLKAEELVKEQICSYEDFIHNWIPTFLMQNKISVSNANRNLSLDIINFSICKPARYVNRQGKRPLTPADARSNDYNYMARLYIDFKITDQRGSEIDEFIESKVCVGGIPAMVRSSVCHLNKRLPSEAAVMGECPYDLGGYFIIKGGERVIIPQERPSENTIFVFEEKKDKNKNIIRAEVKSTIDQRFFPIKPCSVKLSKDLQLRVYLTYGKHPIPIGIIFKAFGIVLDKEIQKCLLDISDPSNEEFINIISISLKESSHVLTREDAIRAISNSINIHIDPREYSSSKITDDIKDKFKLKYTMDLLNRDFLPHVGNQPIKKIRFLSLMTQKLLAAYRDPRLLTDRDSLLSKRLDLAGPLLSQIFRHWFLQLIKDIKQQFGRILTNSTQEQVIGISKAQEIRRIIQKNPIEKKLIQALSTGNWQIGRNNTSSAKKGIAQVLQRLSYSGYLSHLCRINSPLDSSGSKNTLPRKLHGTQFPKICPAETPEGDQVGIVKNKSLLLNVTIETSSVPALYCLEKLGMINISDSSSFQVHSMTKVLINGDLVGLIKNAADTYRIVKIMKYFKLTGTLNKTISIAWDVDFNLLNIHTDGGRYTIPYYRIDEDNHFVADNWVKHHDLEELDFDKMSNPMNIDSLTSEEMKSAKPYNHIALEDFETEIKQAAIEYLDTDEDSTIVIADTPEKLYDGQTYKKINDEGSLYFVGHLTLSVNISGDILEQVYDKVDDDVETELNQIVDSINVVNFKNRLVKIGLVNNELEDYQETILTNLNRLVCGEFTRYTHCMIHPAQIHGVIASNIPFSDHNPSPRNCYQSSMGKQALGIFATNYHIRWDTMSNILCYPQRPITQTRTAKYINLDHLFHGYLSMHCICTYSGYNQEDSLIGSMDSAKRGAFNSLYYRTYVSQLRRITTNRDGEESFKVPPVNGTIGRKMGAGKSDRYHAIVSRGKKDTKSNPELPEIGSILEAGDVIIPKTKNVYKNELMLHSDNSITVRPAEGGVIDAVIPSEEYPNDENEEGYKIVKVRLVELRQPEIGDKFASMSAQKGTLGIQFNSADMIKSSISGSPDTIMNPHAIPSRMTLGQLLAAACSLYGALTGEFMDCTPFTEFDINDIYDKLKRLGYDYGGEQFMYNGWTGDLLGVIYYTPTYYQRLKHMVKDKMHARDSGPTQSLTRQPADGRAKGGGLRIGEMERDALIAHGLTMFLREKFCESSDIFEVYVSPEKQTVISANPRHGIYKYGTEKVYSDGVKRVIMPYATELFRKELLQAMVKMVYTFQDSNYI
jgi:DNA-directed RNA polymerase II subunit RPB2